MRQLKVKSLNDQSGMMLLEALIAILIFSFGILGMVAINARAVQAATDSQTRADAARFASEIASLIALNVARDATNGVSAASLQTFEHQNTPALNPDEEPCKVAFTGAASTQAVVTQWVSSVTQSGRYGGLPGATASGLQILVNTNQAAFNSVTITMCWQPPGENLKPRHHVLVAHVN